MAIKMNGYNVIGVLSKPMTGRAALKSLRDDFGQTPAHARDAMRTCLHYGIAAKQTGVVGEFVAVYPKRTRDGIRFVIEDGTSPKKVRADRPERVALTRPVRYSSGVAKERSSAPNQTTKEFSMAARTAARPAAKAAPARAAKPAAKAATTTRKAKAAPVEEPEDLELEEELEDEELEDELEDEEDEDLEDEDESDEDEEDEEEDEEAEEEDEESDEAPDYTPYASKAITPVMEDFAQWIDDEIFQPTGTSIAEVGADDPVRLIAIAGTVRMEFQKSEFNHRRREERKKEKAAPKAVAKPAAKAPAAKATAKPAAKVAAKPAAKVAAKPAARPAAKATAAKPAAAKATGPRSTTRRKGPAPY